MFSSCLLKRFWKDNLPCKLKAKKILSQKLRAKILCHGKFTLMSNNGKLNWKQCSPCHWVNLTTTTIFIYKFIWYKGLVPQIATQLVKVGQDKHEKKIMFTHSLSHSHTLQYHSKVSWQSQLNPRENGGSNQESRFDSFQSWFNPRYSILAWITEPKHSWLVMVLRKSFISWGMKNIIVHSCQSFHKCRKLKGQDGGSGITESICLWKIG